MPPISAFIGSTSPCTKYTPRKLSPEQLLERRQERWVNYGKFKEMAE